MRRTISGELREEDEFSQRLEIALWGRVAAALALELDGATAVADARPDLAGVMQVSELLGPLSEAVQ